MQISLWIIGAYLLGSIPFGLIIAKCLCGVDPRYAGSCNVGSTNVARLCGKKYGALTLLCDVTKGALPVWLCQSSEAVAQIANFADALAFPPSSLLASFVALASIIGHSRSIFLGFKGGKSVAITVGVFIPLAFWQLLLAAFICIIIIWRSKFVSLGSLSLVTLLPIFLAFSNRFDLLPLALSIAAFVFVRHKENIQRLLKGEEKAWIKKEPQA